MAAKNKSNSIEITRVYDAPVKTVWEAWTDPEQVAKWWGPRGFTLTTHRKVLKNGGHWDYTMHGPDGTDWPNVTRYLEVEKYKRLVYDHGGSHDRPPLFRVTVSFHELPGGKTKMEMSMVLPTPEEAEKTRKFIKDAGGNSTWDRLAEYLAKESTGKEKFVINRSFGVPLETMFEAWTNPDHLMRWLPPTGFTMKYVNADLRPGGSAMYVMTNGADITMYGQAQYIEVTRPNRIVYTQNFCDRDGKLSRHPLAPTWPASMLTVVTLTSEGPDRTRVTVEWEVHGEATAEEMATFIAGRAGMTGGWTGSFDKLEEYLIAL